VSDHRDLVRKVLHNFRTASMGAKFQMEYNSGRNVLYVHTQDHGAARRQIVKGCKPNKLSLFSWDAERGLQLLHKGEMEGAAENAVAEMCGNPANMIALNSIRSLKQFQLKLNRRNGSVLLVDDGHLHIDAPMAATLRNLAIDEQQNNLTVVLLCSVLKLPPELSRYAHVLVDDLATQEELRALVEEIDPDPEVPYTEEELSAITDAAKGRTYAEATQDYAYSLSMGSRLLPPLLSEIKCESLRQEGLLTVLKSETGLEGVGGMDTLKNYLRLIAAQRNNPYDAKPKGFILLGPPGVGKSFSVAAMGAETGWPVLLMDVGAMMGSLVGQSEERLRKALRTADAMAPCWLVIDEIEKALGGMGGSSTTLDGGVGGRIMSTLLTWLNDHTTEVLVCGTANSLDSLDGALTRAGRFDAVFFVDLPSLEEKRAIWELYTQKFKWTMEDYEKSGINDTDWTGSEIKACCRMSRMLGVSLGEASAYVIPVAVSDKERLDKLRANAAARYLSANYPGLYSLHKSKSRSEAQPFAEKPRRVKKGHNLEQGQN